MSSVQETAAAGEICPGCDSLKQNVEFKTYYHEGGDTIVCEDCFNEMEGSEEEDEEEDEEEEWCEEHEQVMWKNGLKCSGCLEGEEEEEEESE
jgi:hypothetical protein